LFEVRTTNGIFVALIEFRLGLVDLVHQQHHRIRRLDGLEQRPRGEKAVGEEGVVLAGDLRHRVRQRRRVGNQLADPIAKELGVEELLGVLPLVEGLALVEPLVALETDEPPVRDLGERLGQLRLPDARGPFDEHRPAHLRREVYHGGDSPVCDVAGILEALLDVLHRSEHGRSLE
jgi:hypothetical protein